MISNTIKNWIQASVKVLLVASVCFMLVISNVVPAAQAATSKPSDGEVSLNEIQKKTDDIARSSPRNLEETIKDAEGGLNAVQGKADKDKMVSPDEAQGTTVMEQVKNLLK